jgi:hypothetical protein
MRPHFVQDGTHRALRRLLRRLAAALSRERTGGSAVPELMVIRVQ